MECKLKTLECHFTWDLELSRYSLFCLQDNLNDISPEDGGCWLGHIYNLQGFIHYQLGLIDTAQQFFSRATEAFGQIKCTHEGPWLMVNYGNLAWLYHKLGDVAESNAYLVKLDDLMTEYQPLVKGELHPEIYTEKAWTLMTCDKARNPQVLEYFEKAIKVQPGRMDWQTSYVLALLIDCKCNNKKIDRNILEKMRNAMEGDPENLYLAAVFLEAQDEKGEDVRREVHKLGERILAKPVGSYSGLRQILRLYRKHLSVDEAINLAERALKRHPDKRYLKWCVANNYKWKIYSREPLEHNWLEKVISLWMEVISLYPHSSVLMKMTLANIYGYSSEQDKSDKIYEELLEMDLDVTIKQMIYKYYANYLYHMKQEAEKSLDYHMKAAKISPHTRHGKDSMNILKKNQRNRKVQNFLSKLQH
ncbi:interferon-induced protein with tetratricopeptide repeats 2-like [Pholidichthys leucotaenia]